VRGPRPTPCIFPEYFLQEARETVRRRSAAVRDVQRAHLVLWLHDHPDWSPDEAAESVGLSARQVQRWRRRWVAGDFSIEDETGRGRKPIFSPAGPRPRASHGL
jgi:Homeodomain-like domain